MRIVQTRTPASLKEIVPLIPSDPKLDATTALSSLLVTQTHIVIRYDEYGELYPGELGCLFASQDFLEEKPEKLAAGYSRMLLTQAKKARLARGRPRLPSFQRDSERVREDVRPLGAHAH